ncbi:MarR family winged helix-turn-helix transcriptional regulator [Paenibacillus solisilvae]|uniref:MarR family winged helix-turn-helix transcriptional regulator n=1 Tax=Paenibacillus solisilvae TaxID=2486751 RepID=A0ABW0VW95_9BACL
MDRSIGFLMGVTYRKLSNLLLQRLRNYDITPEQWSVLHRIYEQEGTIQKDLALRSGKDKPTTTRILDTLEAKGLIKKQPDASDRRSTLIFMSVKGSRLIAETVSIEQQVIKDATAGISDEEHNLLIDLLLRIGDTISGISDQQHE